MNSVSQYFFKVVACLFYGCFNCVSCNCRTLFPAELHHLTWNLLESADVHPDSRSYALTIEDFDRLCSAYQRLCDQNPGLFEYDYRAPKARASDAEAHLGAPKDAADARVL